MFNKKDGTQTARRQIFGLLVSIKKVSLRLEGIGAHD